MYIFYMKKYFFCGLILLALTTFGAAQTSEVQLEPGLIGSSSSLYGLDVAFDNAMVSTGLMDKGELVFERASEASIAEEQNSSTGVQNALNQLNRVSDTIQQNGNESVEGLENAEKVLNRVQERVRERSNSTGFEGVGNALENVRGARNRLSGGPFDDIETHPVNPVNPVGN